MRGQSIFCEKLKIEIVYRFHQIIAKFDEIGTFQFLPDFTTNALTYHIVKPHKYAVPLWKTGKILTFCDIKKLCLEKFWNRPY